jgi:hypothetical protein
VRRLLFSVLAFGTFACNSADYVDKQPDADAARPALKPGECAAPPAVKCDGGTPGAGSCVPDLDAGVLSTYDASVALGCRVEFTYPDPLPRINECYLEEVCGCIVGADGGPTWLCRR